MNTSPLWLSVLNIYRFSDECVCAFFPVSIQSVTEWFFVLMQCNVYGGHERESKNVFYVRPAKCKLYGEITWQLKFNVFRSSDDSISTRITSINAIKSNEEREKKQLIQLIYKRKNALKILGIFIRIFHRRRLFFCICFLYQMLLTICLRLGSIYAYNSFKLL